MSVVSRPARAPGPDSAPDPRGERRLPRPSLRLPPPRPSGTSRITPPSKTVLVGERADLVRAVESVTATLSTPAPQQLIAAHLPARWGTAETVLVGVDAAPEVVDLGLPVRPGVHLLGVESDLADLGRWSAALGASLVVLPRDSTVLARVMQGGSAPEAARVVAVVSGGGGAGASTTAAGLAGAAVRDGRSAVLVDLDPWGGGLDLLLGVEGRPGWRWGDLARARGSLGSLTGRLPGSEGVDLVAMGHGAPYRLPDEAAVDCVLAAARASYDLVVLDVSARPPWDEHLARAGAALVVVGPGIRQISAARQAVEECSSAGLELRLVARTAAGGSAAVTGELVSDALGLPTAGVVPYEGRLAAAAERGDVPWRVARRPWRNACRQVLESLEAWAPIGGRVR